jgi:hypothetical protein
MEDPKPSPFALNRGRVVLLVLGAILVLIAISTWLGGLDAYQQLREANDAAKATEVEQATEPTLSP